MGADQAQQIPWKVRQSAFVECFLECFLSRKGRSPVAEDNPERIYWKVCPNASVECFLESTRKFFSESTPNPNKFTERCVKVLFLSAVFGSSVRADNPQQQGRNHWQVCLCSSRVHVVYLRWEQSHSKQVTSTCRLALSTAFVEHVTERSRR